MEKPWKNLPEDRSNIFAFVYIIYNNHPKSEKKYYIGCKKALKRIKRKPLKGKKRNRIDWVENKVDDYWGSSKELLSDIEKYGLEYFEREVIEFCDSQFDLKYSELCWQLLTKCIFDDRSYNSMINVRLGRVPKNFVDKERDISILKI